MTKSTRDVASLMVESQYFVGALSSFGHSMRSHSYSRGADNAVSRLAGRTRVAAKRDVNGFAVPSRQETLLNADSGNASAMFFTRVGCRREVRRIRIGFLPRLLLRALSNLEWTIRAYEQGLYRLWKPWVSGAGELHPRALSEPYVNLSTHTAPAIQPAIPKVSQWTKRSV